MISQLDFAVRDLAVICYNRLGTEGEHSRNEAGESYNFEDAPKSVYDILNRYRLARVGGKTYERKAFMKLLDKLRCGDTLVFDSVSRMSRNADEGIALYMELYNKGIELVFLKERYIDTQVYISNLKDRIQLTGAIEDEIFKGINSYFRALAEKQIRIAFEQAEKEVQDLHTLRSSSSSGRDPGPGSRCRSC